MKSKKRPYHKIRRLDVTGGFLHGMSLEFGAHLNCIIGARGTGKSTVLELLRWALGQMPDLNDTERYRDVERMVQANLGTGHVKVELETQHGVRYTVQRKCGEEATVVDERGDPVAIDIGKGTIFSAAVYSQNQIEDIAKDPLFQLKLIDKFVSDQVRELNSRLKAVVQSLESNAMSTIAIRGEIVALEEKTAELGDITEKLKAFKIDETTAEQKQIQVESQAKALRDQEKRSLARIVASFTEGPDGLAGVLRDWEKQLAAAWNDEVFKGRNEALFQEVRALATQSIKTASAKIQEALAEVASARSALQGKKESLDTLHLRQEQAYQTLLDRSVKEKERTRERDALLQRHGELIESQKKLDQCRTELSNLTKSRQSLLQQMSELKDERFDLRQGVAKSLTEQLAPHVRVRMAPSGNTDSYREVLLERMKGSGFKYTQVVDRLVQRIPPTEFAAILQRADVQALQDQLEIEADRANRIVLHLKDSKSAFDIEVLELHDLPSIELKDGPDYKDSAILSTGQKCTTILPILLLESASPLLIDQPEDNLDNTYIYETIVKSVLEVHDQRQLIFVTHNANIPVLGDAENIFVLQSTGRQSRLKASGDVDAVKEEIESVMEGGKEAFKRRSARYGYA